jgi:hypothetical protein
MPQMTMGSAHVTLPWIPTLSPLRTSAVDVHTPSSIVPPDAKSATTTV